MWKKIISVLLTCTIFTGTGINIIKIKADDGDDGNGTGRSKEEWVRFVKQVDAYIAFANDANTELKSIQSQTENTINKVKNSRLQLKDKDSRIWLKDTLKSVNKVESLQEKLDSIIVPKDDDDFIVKLDTEFQNILKTYTQVLNLLADSITAKNMKKFASANNGVLKLKKELFSFEILITDTLGDIMMFNKEGYKIYEQWWDEGGSESLDETEYQDTDEDGTEDSN